MRIARIDTADGPRAVVADGDHWAGVVSPFDLTRTGQQYPRSAVLLAPIAPGAVVGVSHPTNPDGTERVQGWWKSPRTVCGPAATIRRARWSSATVAEGELALIIGTRATELTADTALRHVLGYTAANDVTTTAPQQDSAFFAAKVGDNFTPLGPWIETELPDPDTAVITVSVDGAPVQTSSTATLPHSITQILVALTRHVTLEPGDVVLTGSPNTAAELGAGQCVEITVEGIGTLRNTVS